MGDQLMLIQFVGPVAGVPVLHIASPEIVFDGEGKPARGATAPPEAVTIRHQPGTIDVTALEPLFTVVPGLSYYRDDAGQPVVYHRGTEGQRSATLIRVSRPGYEYAVTYEPAPSRPVAPRAAEIVAYALALAARGGGLMAHGCGLVLPDGSGALCLGVSGAGKSTLARMMLTVPGIRVLNDDRNVVTFDGSGATLWGTPWPGTAGIANTGTAPLRAIALIARAPEPTLRELAPREAIPRLLQTLLLPIWGLDGAEEELGMVGRLCESLPVVELAYPLGADVPQRLADMLGATVTR